MLTVKNTGSKDVESINIEVYSQIGELVAYGSYNQKTNWVHITICDEFSRDSSSLEETIVEGIESGNLKIE